MALSIGQRFNNGIQAAIRATSNVSAAPFIGANDPRWTSFMGINVPEHAVRTPMGRIEIARRAVWVYACTRARADAIKSIPLKLYQLSKGGGRTEYLDHPIVRLLEDVNPYIDTPATIRAATEQGICLHGRYQWKKVRNNADIVVEVYGLPSQCATPVPGANGIDHWVYENNVGGKRIREIYKPDDIVYFRTNEFDDGIDGLGPLQVAVETTIADISITVTQNAMSRNAARPSAVMTVLNKMNDTDYERENQRVQNAYAGAVNAGKIILIDNAQDTKFQTVQLSPSEMMWIQEHDSHIKDLCAAFRTPPGVAGDYGEASRIANLGGMHRLFAEVCIRPELMDMELALNWQLLWTEDWGRGIGWERKNNLFLAHDLEGVSMFREDETARTNRAVQAFTSGASWDEVRLMHGLDPQGGDLGKTSFIPANVVPVQQLLNPPTDTGTDSPTGADTSTEVIAATPEKNPPNEAEARETNDAVKALAEFEKKQYRKWKRTHKTGKFQFKYLGEDEQSSLDDEIRAALSDVRDALGQK
jgi:HK97 family phage portal protein